MYKIIHNKDILRQIKQKGFCIIKNLYSKKEINQIKSNLLEILHYIHPKKIKDLNKKYFQIKKFDKKLKGNFFDLLSHEISTLNILHREELVDLVRKYFKTKVVFSGRPAIHIHDSDNDRFLEPHQELNQFARDFLFVWAPLFDANKEKGSLIVYEKSHLRGYYSHNNDNKLGSSHLKKEIYSKFKKIEIEIKSGDAVMLHSALIHGTLPTKKKGFVKYVMVERFNPLKKIPYLQNSKNPIKIPHFGVDYNQISD